jgi:hypothetical protein
MPNATPAWTTRIWQEYRAGNLTRASRDVLLTLHTYRGTGGVAWPSQATLAERAHTCVRTVQRALDQARVLDLLHSCERRVRAGWRWLRTSNVYRFLTPPEPVQPGLRAARCRARAATTRHTVCEGESQEKDALDEMLRAAAAAPDLLLARRIAMAQRQVTS